MLEILSTQLVEIRCVFYTHNMEEHGLEAVTVHQFTSGEFKSPTSNRTPFPSAFKDWIKLTILD